MRSKLVLSLTIAGLLIITVISLLILSGRNDLAVETAMPADLRTLDDLEPLSEAFRSDSSYVRVIALLSPT